MKNSDTRRKLLWLARPRILCCSSNPVYSVEVSRFAAKARNQLVAWAFSQPPFLHMSIKHYAIFNGIVKRPRVPNFVTREVVGIYVVPKRENSGESLSVDGALYSKLSCLRTGYPTYIAAALPELCSVLC